MITQKAGEGHKLNEDRPSTSRQTPRESDHAHREVNYERSMSEEKQRAASAALARSEDQAKKGQFSDFLYYYGKKYFDKNIQKWLKATNPCFLPLF